MTKIDTSAEAVAAMAAELENEAAVEAAAKEQRT